MAENSPNFVKWSRKKKRISLKDRKNMNFVSPVLSLTCWRNLIPSVIEIFEFFRDGMLEFATFFFSVFFFPLSFDWLKKFAIFFYRPFDEYSVFCYRSTDENHGLYCDTLMKLVVLFREHLMKFMLLFDWRSTKFAGFFCEDFKKDRDW